MTDSRYPGPASRSPRPARPLRALPPPRRLHPADRRLRFLVDNAAGELDGGAQVRFNVQSVDVGERAQCDVADAGALAEEDAGWVVQRGAFVEAEVHVLRIDGDVAEAPLLPLRRVVKADADSVVGVPVGL